MTKWTAAAWLQRAWSRNAAEISGGLFSKVVRLGRKNLTFSER